MLKDSTLVQYRGWADRRLGRLLTIPTVTPAGAVLQRQTKRWRSQVVTFMIDREVPPTNTREHKG